MSHSGSPDQSYMSDPGCMVSLAIRVTHQEGRGQGWCSGESGHPRAPGGISADMVIRQDALMKNI